MKKFLGLIFILILLTACSSSLKPTDPSALIEKNVGDDFQIIIESNPTTGYHWEIIDPASLKEIQFVGKEYKSMSDPGLVGRGGLDIFTFKVFTPGEITITIGNYPPSNNPVDPVTTMSFKVVAK